MSDAREEEILSSLAGPALNTRPDSEIFDDEEEFLPESGDEETVDTGEIPEDNRNLVDQLKADEAAAKAEKERKAKGEGETEDDDGIVFEDEETGTETETKRAKKEEYGPKVQKRINKEVSKRKRIETERDDLRRKLAEYEQRDFDAQGQRAKSAVTHHEGIISESEAKLDRLRADLKKANEDGESERSAQIIDEMTDAKIDIRQSREYLKRAKHDSERYDQDVEAGRTRQQTQEQQQYQTIPALENWRRDNASWYERDPAATDTAHRVESLVFAAHQRGDFEHGPDADEYWAEVNRRLHAEMPDLEIANFEAEEVEEEDEDGEPKPRPAQRRRATPVSGNRRNAPPDNDGVANRKGRVVITATDKQTMRSMKLDPNNREHVKAYAREKERMGVSDAAE